MPLRRANDKGRHAVRTANIFFETAKIQQTGRVAHTQSVAIRWEEGRNKKINGIITCCVESD